MSADNWAKCPKCASNTAKERAALAGQYGKIPMEEFQARLDCMRELDEEVGYHFREDYEIYGADEGDVVVSYRGSCSDCGLTLRFEEHHPLPGVK